VPLFQIIRNPLVYLQTLTFIECVNFIFIGKKLGQKMSSSTSVRPFEQGAQIGTYEIVKQIGSGGYGYIYAVKNLETNKCYAMKIEITSEKHMHLRREAKIMERIQTSIYFPAIYDVGRGATFKYIVMDLLGPSLSSARRAVKTQKYSAYTILRVSMEMLYCVAAFHEYGYVHRDVKPGNFLIRPDRKHPLCMIDFGLSSKYIDSATGRHIEINDTAGFTGTCRYASLHAHEGFELSRRDDLISWFYSIMEMAGGALPWPGRSDRELTEKMKAEMTPHQLCENLPMQFVLIWRYISGLEFDEDPDYFYIDSELRKAYKQATFEAKHFDWEDLSEESKARISRIPWDFGKEETLPESPLKKKCFCNCCYVS
jgi:serine/threonine protein kinase